MTRNEITLTETTDSSRESLQEYIRTHDPSELLIYEYDFDSILTATSNFSITNKLGEGGFGAVYRVIIRLYFLHLKGKYIII